MVSIASRIPNTPDDVDIPALRVKYRAERDKRLRADGSTQYLELTADFAAFSEVDPHTPLVEREPLSVEADVLILGGGGEGVRSHLGEPYAPGFYAFGELLAQWRATGNMEGMQLRS